MIYEIRHFDNLVLKFEVISTKPIELRILSKTESKQDIPIGFEFTDEGLLKWLRKRIIPKRRGGSKSFLNNQGLNIAKPIEIVEKSFLLSLVDCYWVVPENFEGKFEDYDLYDHDINHALAMLAFTGNITPVTSTRCFSPEFTTNGLMPKFWERHDGKLSLFKGGFNNEPFAEFYGSQVARALGANAVTYGLIRRNGEICSKCDIFTDKTTSFVPINQFVKHGGIQAARRFYYSLGEEFASDYNKMIVLDAIIANSDRHLGGFGMLVDSKTNEIKAPAPVFDNGDSLINIPNNLDINDFDKFVNEQIPFLYDDYFGMARIGFKGEIVDRVSELRHFTFEKHERYNLSDEYLEKITNKIHERAEKMLEFAK